MLRSLLELLWLSDFVQCPTATKRAVRGLDPSVVRADGVRADGVRADGVRADGVRADILLLPSAAFRAETLILALQFVSSSELLRNSDLDFLNWILEFRMDSPRDGRRIEASTMADAALTAFDRCRSAPRALARRARLTARNGAGWKATAIFRYKPSLTRSLGVVSNSLCQRGGQRY